MTTNNTPCRDCNNRKTYIGLLTVEPCQRCAGSGVEPRPPLTATVDDTAFEWVPWRAQRGNPPQLVVYTFRVYWVYDTRDLWAARVNDRTAWIDKHGSNKGDLWGGLQPECQLALRTKIAQRNLYEPNGRVEQGVTQ